MRSLRVASNFSLFLGLSDLPLFLPCTHTNAHTLTSDFSLPFPSPSSPPTQAALAQILYSRDDLLLDGMRPGSVIKAISLCLYDTNYASVDVYTDLYITVKLVNPLITNFTLSEYLTEAPVTGMTAFAGPFNFIPRMPRESNLFWKIAANPGAEFTWDGSSTLIVEVSYRCVFVRMCARVCARV